MNSQIDIVLMLIKMRKNVFFLNLILFVRLYYKHVNISKSGQRFVEKN